MEEDDSFTDKISLELEKNSIVSEECKHVGMLSIKTANKSVEDALKMPDPVDLYYGLLNEGEVACLFADSNAGKSIFAVQMADYISRFRKVLYVDENGDYINEGVGRCNHESSCGYHYTPKQFFADNPTARPNWTDNFFRLPQPVVKSTIKKQIWTITSDIVISSVNPSIDSDFTLFLASVIGRENTLKVVRDYRIGVTKSRDVIFYQIDIEGRCRTGKIMKYNRMTGHRIKDENVGGKITWVHSILKKSSNPKLRLPDRWNLTQCLFGEHLLKQYPFKNVAIVESEKTAVICSSFWPEYVWLATGGKSQLNSRLQVLKGRKIVAFPDVDGYQEWKEKLSQLRELDIMVSDVLEKNATAEDRDNHVDIADLLIRQYRKEHIAITPVEVIRDPMKNPTFLKMREYAELGNLEEIALLIDDLDLEMVGCRKLNN